MANLLIVNAKKTDFCTLFLLQESIPFSAEVFYHWLVAQDVDVGVLEEISAAVSQLPQILDVSVAQMFLSRTAQQHICQDLSCKVDDSSLLLDENNDDEL